MKIKVIVDNEEELAKFSEDSYSNNDCAIVFTVLNKDKAEKFITDLIKNKVDNFTQITGLRINNVIYNYKTKLNIFDKIKMLF